MDGRLKRKVTFIIAGAFPIWRRLTPSSKRLADRSSNLNAADRHCGRDGSRRISPSCRSCCGANQAMSVATKALESEDARAYTPLVGHLRLATRQSSTPGQCIRSKVHSTGRRQSRRLLHPGGFAVCRAAPCVGQGAFAASRRPGQSSNKTPAFTNANCRADRFSLWFRGPVAVCKRSCKSRNRIACASSDEYRGRDPRDSDRTAAELGLRPNCSFGQSSQHLRREQTIRMLLPRCAIGHKLGTQTYKGQAGRQIATLFERPA